MQRRNLNLDDPKPLADHLEPGNRAPGWPIRTRYDALLPQVASDGELTSDDSVLTESPLLPRHHLDLIPHETAPPQAPSPTPNINPAFLFIIPPPPPSKPPLLPPLPPPAVNAAVLPPPAPTSTDNVPAAQHELRREKRGPGRPKGAKNKKPGEPGYVDRKASKKAESAQQTKRAKGKGLRTSAKPADAVARPPTLEPNEPTGQGTGSTFVAPTAPMVANASTGPQDHRAFTRPQFPSAMENSPFDDGWICPSTTAAPPGPYPFQDAAGLELDDSFGSHTLRQQQPSAGSLLGPQVYGNTPAPGTGTPFAGRRGAVPSPLAWPPNGFSTQLQPPLPPPPPHSMDQTITAGTTSPSQLYPGQQSHPFPPASTQFVPSPQGLYRTWPAVAIMNSFNGGIHAPYNVRQPMPPAPPQESDQQWDWTSFKPADA
ncbi:MAG: hypothetical protein Q9163_002336 [Psora crenata]